MNVVEQQQDRMRGRGPHEEIADRFEQPIALTLRVQRIASRQIADARDELLNDPVITELGEHLELDDAKIVDDPRSAHAC